MATKIAVEIVGDSASLERSFARSAASAKVFDKEVGTAARGSLAASGAFKSMGRSIAFASGGFLAFGAAAGAIKSSITAAQQAEVTHRQLATTIRASGSSIGQWQKGIDNAGLSLAKFGFTTDESQDALNTLVRSTGSVGKALSVMGVAADIARAKNISLNAASLLVGKAVDGQTTGLRRLGVELPKTAKGMELIRDAGKAFAGQAKASTTETEKFHATLHDTEIIVGTALLPAFNHLLDSLGKWLQKMNESGRLQRDVNSAVKTGTALLHGLKAIVDPLVSAFKDFGGAVGGTKNEVELLTTAFILLKTRALAIEWGLIGTNIAGVGTKAAVSAGEVDGLAGSLTALDGMAPIVIPITLAIGGAIGLKQLEKWAGKGISASFSPSGGGTATGSTPVPTLNNPSTWSPAELAAVAAQRGPETAAYYLQHPAAAMAVVQAFKKRSGGRITPGVLTGTGTATSRAGAAASAAPPHDLPANAVVPFSATPLTGHQQLTNALTADPNNLTLLGRQVAYDKAALASAARQRADGRIDNKRYQQEYANYMGDLVSTQQTITSITQAAASKVAAEKKKQADAIKRVSVPGSLSGSEKTIKAMLGKQHESPEQYVAGAEKPGHFERLGPLRASSYNIPLGLQLASARDTAMNDQGGLLTIAHLEVAAARRALKSGKLGIQGQIDAWNVIDQANQQLGTTMKQGAKVASSRALTAGLNLTRMQRIALEARASTSAAFSGHVPTTTGVLGQSVNITHLHLHGVQDVHGLADSLSKLSRSKGAPQTVGPNAGRSRAQ